MSRTIGIDHLSPETVTALAIDLGELPDAIVMPQGEAYKADPEQAERLAEFEGQRVRLTITGRKMAVPGRLQGGTLVTNWGLELDTSTCKVEKVEVRNPDTGRFEAPKVEELQAA